MSIKINVNGMEITVSNTTEAAELIAKINAHPEKAGKTRVNSSARQNPSDFVVRPEVSESTLKFLLTIRDAGPSGADAATIAKTLKAASGKGIGGRVTPINTYLTSLGFKVEAVYDNSRTLDGRRWTMGRRFQEALEMVQSG